MNRVEKLLLLWQDQSMTADDLAELKRLLASPEGRARAATDFFLTGVVLESLQARHAAGELRAQPTDQPPAEKRLVIRRPESAGRRRLMWLAGSAAASMLLAVGAGYWFRIVPAPPISPPVFAQFEKVQGDTFIVSQQQRQPAQAGQVLSPGQGIATQGAGSEAVVQLEDAARLKLGGDTTVFTTTECDKPDSGRLRVVLEQGDLFVQATRSLKRKLMTVETPLGVAIAETEDTALHVSDTAGVVVARGEVTFVHKATDKSISVKGGQYVVATPEGDVYAARLFAGKGQVWAAFPSSGLDTNALGFAVAFAPDSQRLAAVGPNADHSGRLGRVDEAEPSMDFRGERTVCFSPDGQLLATTEPGCVLLYAAATGQPLHVLKRKDLRVRATCLAFAPDGKTVAVGRVGWRDQGGAVELWDLPTGTLRHTCRGHAATVTCLAFAPDGKNLATGSLDKTVVLWDPATGQERARALMVSAPVVWSLAFAPDGKTLAIATGTDDFRLREPGDVRLWDVATETVRMTLHGHNRSVTSVIFSPDGGTLITGSADTTVRFWDAGRGREYGMLKGHQAAPGFDALGVALSADGNWLATVSFDRTVKVWKTTWTKDEAGKRITGHVHRNPRHALGRHCLAYMAQP